MRDRRVNRGGDIEGDILQYREEYRVGGRGGDRGKDR